MFAGCLLFARETGRIGRGNSECGVVSERPKAGGLRQSLAMGERISGGGTRFAIRRGSSNGSGWWPVVWLREDGRMRDEGWGGKKEEAVRKRRDGG